MNHPFYTFTGNPLSQSGFKGQKQISYMENRVGFVSVKSRKAFFFAVRKASGAKSWNELKDMLCLPRTSFQNYQYGNWLLPADVFDLILQILPKENQQFFFEQVFTKPWNWGCVKGGEENFKRNKAKLLRHLKDVRPKSGPGSRGYLKPVDLNQPLSEDFCELIGAIIGDGCIDGHVNKRGKSAYHMSITGDAELDKDYLTKNIASILSGLFKVKSFFYYRKDSRTLILSFYSKLVFSLLTKRFGFSAGKKTFTVKIPEEILNSSKELIFATIRGIFDTDGSVFIDTRKIYTRPYGRITLKVVSKPMHAQLKEFLQKHFSLYVAVKIDRKSFSNSPKYEITIYGNGQINKWMHLIGFSNERHLCKIRKLVESSGRDSNPRSAALPVHRTYKAAALPLGHQSNLRSNILITCNNP